VSLQLYNILLALRIQGTVLALSGEEKLCMANNIVLVGLVTVIHRFFVFYDLERQTCHARVHCALRGRVHVCSVRANIDTDHVDHHRGKLLRSNYTSEFICSTCHA